MRRSFTLFSIVVHAVAISAALIAQAIHITVDRSMASQN